jgi:hypothetical protein
MVPRADRNNEACNTAKQQELEKLKDFDTYQNCGRQRSRQTINHMGANRKGRYCKSLNYMQRIPRRRNISDRLTHSTKNISKNAVSTSNH